MDTLREEMLQGALKMKYDMTEKDLHQGWATLQLQPDWLQLGLHEWEFAQLHSRAITPDTVRVFVSPLAEKVLPIKVTLAGQPPAGLTLQGEPATAPSQVLVHGPAIAVNSMDSVATEDVPLWKLTLRHLRGAAHPEQGGAGHAGQRPARAGHAGPERPHRAGQHPRHRRDPHPADLHRRAPEPAVAPAMRYDAQVEQDARTVSVTISAEAEDLKKLSADKIRAYLDLTVLVGEQIEAGASAPYREPVVVHLPAGINAASVQVTPPLVTVLLKNPASRYNTASGPFSCAGIVSWHCSEST